VIRILSGRSGFYLVDGGRKFLSFLKHPYSMWGLPFFPLNWCSSSFAWKERNWTWS